MAPMRGTKVVEAFHEPARPSNCSLPWESGAEDARTPDASRPPGVSEPREASGVRPIYRRFSSGAGRPAVHGPNGLSLRHAEFIRGWCFTADFDTRETVRGNIS